MKKQKESQCPKCETGVLKYQGCTVAREFFYKYTCVKCGFEGREYFSLLFKHHTDRQGNKVKSIN